MATTEDDKNLNDSLEIFQVLANLSDIDGDFLTELLVDIFQPPENL